jgi:hypothetical protein
MTRQNNGQSGVYYKEETMYDLKELGLHELFQVRDALAILTGYGIDVKELADSVDTEILTREG